MINDISKAFFHAKAKREVFVQMPAEDLEPGEDGICILTVQYNVYYPFVL